MNDFRKIKSDEGDFDIQKLIARVLDHWLLFAISLFVCMILSILYIWYATPSYKVHAQVLIKDDQNGSNGAFSFMGGAQMQQLGNLFGIKSNVNDELGILETRDLIEQVVRDLKLNIVYYNERLVKSVEMYDNSPFKINFLPFNDSVASSQIRINFNADHNSFTLTSSNVDINNPHAKLGDTIITSIGTIVFYKTGFPFEGDSYVISLSSLDQTVTNLSPQFDMSILDNKSNIISLTLNTSIPRKGEDILQKLIDVYIQRNLAEKNKISDSTLAFIRERVAIVSADLNNIEANIQGFKQKTDLLILMNNQKHL